MCADLDRRNSTSALAYSGWRHVTDIDGGDAWLYGGRILASNAILHDDVRRFLP